MTRKNKNIIIIALSIVFFTTLACISKVGYYSDSEQYLTMHIHREPVYPLWLWGIRMLFGGYFEAGVLIAQAGLAILCTSYFCIFIAKEFELKYLAEEIVIWGIVISPHLLTPLASQSGLVLSTSLLSEALCIPVFLVFMTETYKIVTRDRRLPVFTGFLLCLLLSLTRSQMMFTIVLWAITVSARFVIRKNYKKLLLVLLAAFMFFTARGNIIKTYNYIFNDRFIENTYGPVNILTHIMYASEETMGEKIEEDEVKAVFYQLYDKMEEQGYHYTSFQGNLWEGSEHLESVHDNLKFYVLESSLNDYFKEKGIDDYIDRNLYSDEYAVIMIKALWPQCFIRWSLNYLLLGVRGVIRSMGIVHPWFNAFCIVLIGYLLWESIRGLRKNPTSRIGWLGIISLLAVFGLAFSTAITIMCLSRYMIYGFAGIYVSLFILTVHRWAATLNLSKKQ